MTIRDDIEESMRRLQEDAWPSRKLIVSQHYYDLLLTRVLANGHTEAELQAIVEVLPEAPRPAHPRRGGLARLT